MSASTIVTEARKWIDGLSAPGGLSGSWRLLMLEKSDRVRPDGTVQEVPLKIRRFAQGCPWALLHEAMKYLCESAPYTGIVYNGLELDGTYRPTRTRWVRDDNVTVDKNRADNTYTLIQDLVDADNPSYAVGSGGSCSEEVVTEWHWDASSVEDVPAAPRQGVSYSIQSVGRNEDGSFNYALVKRTAITQHMVSVVTECGEFETVTVETWDNVYGEYPSFTDNFGNAVSVPSACAAPDGTTVELAVQENQDCTLRIAATTKVAKNVSTERSTQKTIYEHDASDTVRADDAALSDAPLASGGVIVTRKSELRPDGKYDNTEQVKSEREVLSSSKTVTVTRRGRRVTVVDTNQAAPAETAGLPVGHEVKVEKTPGGLYVNTRSEWERGNPLRAGEKCAVDLMKHVDETTTAGAEMPQPGDHVVGGGVGGHVRSRVTTVGDEGDVVQVVTDELERQVLAQRESWRVGLNGVIHSVTDMHVATPATAPSYSRANVGLVVENEKTPGGLINVTRSQIDRTGSPIGAGGGCARTVFEHSDSTVTSYPNGSLGGHAPEARDGHYYENTSRLNDDGSSTVTSRDTYEIPYSSAVVTVSKTLHGIRRRTVHRNQTSPASTANLSVGETVTNEITKGGRIDQTIETSDADSVGVIGSECRNHALEHSHSTLSNEALKPSEEVTAAVGKVNERTLRLTEYGTWDVTDTVRTSKVGEASVTSGTPLRTAVRTSYRNAESISSSASGEVNKETSASSSLNEFGRYDGTVETVTHHHADGSAPGGAILAQTTVKVDRNDESDAPSDTPAVNRDVSVSLSVNDHGSYDRTVHVVTYSPRSGQLFGKGADKAVVDVATYNNSVTQEIQETPQVNRDVDVSISQNEHGSYDKSVRVTTYRERLASATSKGSDKAKHSVYTWNNSVSDDVPYSPAVNKSVDVSISQNEHGSYDKSARVTDYEARHAEADNVGSVGALVTVISDNHDTSSAVGYSPDTNRDVEVSISQNEHGSYDKTVRVIDYKKQGDTKTINNPLYDETTSVYANDENAPEGSAPDGQMISTSFSPNQHGTYSTNKTVRTAKQKESTVIHWADTFYDHYKKVYRNYNAPETPEGTNGADSLTPTESSCSFQINDYGLFDGSWEKKITRTGDSWLFFKSTTETVISDDFSWPNDAGRYWMKRTTTEIPVNYYVTRNIVQVYDALSEGFTYNGRSGRVVCSLGSGLMLVARYRKPGESEAEFVQAQI